MPLAPETYTGYDKDGNAIATQRAQDANSYINPEEVKSAIDNLLQTVAQECQNITTALEGVVPDIKSAISVQGKTMSGSVDQICATIVTIPSGIEGRANEVYAKSVEVHDKKQEEYNKQARQAVSGKQGVVRVSP